MVWLKDKTDNKLGNHPTGTKGHAAHLGTAPRGPPIAMGRSLRYFPSNFGPVGQIRAIYVFRFGREAL